MKEIILTIILSFGLGMAFCQSNFSDVIVSSSGNGSNGDVNLSWTIGLPLTKTMVGTNSSLSSGFQSLHFIITEIENKRFDLVDLIVYPNPTQDKLVISSNSENLKYDIYSIDGKYISSSTTTMDQRIINLNTFQQGMYILKIYCNSELIKSFQIIKQ